MDYSTMMMVMQKHQEDNSRKEPPPIKPTKEVEKPLENPREQLVVKEQLVVTEIPRVINNNWLKCSHDTCWLISINIVLLIPIIFMITNSKKNNNK